MNDKGVSILVEYLLLLSILSLFVVVITLQLNHQLEEIQIGKVIENQFSDVSSQISAQIIDTLTISPNNGYMKASIRMPSSIGDKEYTVEFKSVGNFSYIYLLSEDEKYEKYLGLGAATLYFQPQGMTHSLSGNHTIEFEKRTPIFPSAVLIVRPAVVFANASQDGTVEIDVSKSSAFGWWSWRVELWNGTSFEGFGDSVFNITVSWNPTEFQNYCNYDSLNLTAYCNITLTVYDLTYNLNDTDRVTLTITSNESKPPDIYVKKFVIPPQVAPGEPFEVHVYLQGRGIRGEETRTALSVVHAVDVSGSMNYPTMYKSFSGQISPKIWTVQIDVDESYLGKPIAIEVYSPDDFSPWWSGYPKYYAFKLQVEQADGDVWDYNYKFADGVGFYDSYVSSREIGTWTVSVIVAVPKTIPLYLDVYRYEGIWVRTYSTATSYTNNYTVVNITLPTGFTSGDSYQYLILRLSQSTASDFYTWTRYGTFFEFCDDSAYYNGRWLLSYTSTVCYFEPASGGVTYSYYIVPKSFATALNYDGYADIQKLDSARIASISFNNELEASDQVGLVDYSYTAYKHQFNPTSPLYLTTDKSEVNSDIKSLSAEGATNIYYALNQAKEALLENTTVVSGTKPLIILLSDGEPTWGSYAWDPSNPYYDPRCNGASYCDEAAQRATEEADDIKNTYIGGENISICTIAFGYDANEAFLMSIASSKPNGEKCFYQATNVQELIDAYVEIAKAFKIAARNVTITDVVPQGLEILPDSVEVLISGNATASQPVIFTTSNGTAVQVQIPEVYINDEIELVFRVVANEPGDYVLNVQRVSNVTYEPIPFTGSIETVYLNVTYGRISESTKAVVKIS
ncbi:VWA domain-containing protein [Ferroglobus sp.]|uniref:vWA domain-containing protein n=1 Tax=Ferroglobus sp. TaxID=2614230 RepID=UPI0025C06C5B|nr:vWA domain-containing protein [Ferroglobus sp.]